MEEILVGVSVALLEHNLQAKWRRRRDKSTASITNAIPTHEVPSETEINIVANSDVALFESNSSEKMHSESKTPIGSEASVIVIGSSFSMSESDSDFHVSSESSDMATCRQGQSESESEFQVTPEGSFIATSGLSKAKVGSTIQPDLYEAQIIRASEHKSIVDNACRKASSAPQTEVLGVKDSILGESEAFKTAAQEMKAEHFGEKENTEVSAAALATESAQPLASDGPEEEEETYHVEGHSSWVDYFGHR